ncbi:hypothetical protein [uncultured Psychroserpens sp.]|uniref:hypothetical protein n=1 Tax=uncultured Psychroserpens sp. TaxID=255436 RepID=UPI002607530D|nr:hypothetical protein [uncultured Psychroserpens sp.]
MLTKRSTLLLVCLFVTTLSFTQGKRGIKIFNSKTNKEVHIKENRRIRVLTKTGQRISGRFDIVDAKTITIKGNQIKLSDIKKLKRDPLLLSIFSSSILVYGGVLATGIGGLVYVFTGEAQALWLIVSGSAMINIGLKSPNILGAFKTSQDWYYTITTIAN